MVKEKILDWYDKALLLGIEYLPRLALAILVLIIGFWLLNRIGKLFEKAMNKKEVDPSLRGFLKTTIISGPLKTSRIHFQNQP